MIFLNTLILFWAAIGLTFIIVHAKIMDKLKLRPLWEKVPFFKELFKCGLCTGFWVGFLYATPLFLLLVNGLFPILFYIVTLPFAISATCFLYERIIMILLDYSKS